MPNRKLSRKGATAERINAQKKRIAESEVARLRKVVEFRKAKLASAKRKLAAAEKRASTPSS